MTTRAWCVVVWLLKRFKLSSSVETFRRSLRRAAQMLYKLLFLATLSAASGFTAAPRAIIRTTNLRGSHFDGRP